tara:strand:- start:143 stop:430 length:288 start_codon:yes stop_codon:yes gene_type:complete
LTIEKKATDIIKKAEQDRDRKISHAKEQALTQLSAKKKAIQKDQDDHVKEQMDHINEEKEKISQQYEGHVHQVQSKAEKTKEKAVELVLDKILKR